MAAKKEQTEMPGVIRDPSNYRTLSEPFPSFDDANKAINAFFDDVRELRKKHKIPDCYVILKGAALTEAGEEGEWVITQHHGLSLNSEAMTAYAYGREAKARQEAISKLVASGAIGARKDVP